ncbi:Crp/Fnr family transcriptional regulator [Clostridium grantii]|uniref:CRP/FNR family transcriptional regulator, cyclic AMP receptor protein n=1 Tax=Clostridium grantii DSM 8605 TaxID=1121316 RepID=A0A1M5UBF7_9CLOT|nr:Crp/Fnr family transcriptional regulator [Clostridium grantii]SHH60023.1 CRP/FNR family transcriptional regulator, cyclic AMP receptor protein [Clostridium grantii DSM 8605]
MSIESFINNKPYLANLFMGMPAEIRMKCVVENFHAKTVIVKKDEEPKYIYIVYSGTLKIFNEFQNGRILETAIVNDMDFLGLIEILASKEKIAATVETVTDCIALRISKKDFLKWMESDHYLAVIVAKKMAKDFYNIAYSNGELLLNSTMYTIIAYLIKLAKEDIDKGEIVFINKKRQQIADELGISLRTVHRNVKQLKQQQLITIENAKIYINENQYKALIDKLKELS